MCFFHKKLHWGAKNVFFFHKKLHWGVPKLSKTINEWNISQNSNTKIKFGYKNSEVICLKDHKKHLLDHKMAKKCGFPPKIAQRSPKHDQKHI